jgi:hypothetical protein
LKFLQKNEAQSFAALSVTGIRPSPSQAVPRNNT